MISLRLGFTLRASLDVPFLLGNTRFAICVLRFFFRRKRSRDMTLFLAVERNYGLSPYNSPRTKADKELAVCFPFGFVLKEVTHVHALRKNHAVRTTYFCEVFPLKG